jgi:hypothetical protein
MASRILRLNETYLSLHGAFVADSLTRSDRLVRAFALTIAGRYRREPGESQPTQYQDGWQFGNCPQTGFETMSLHLNDHTDRGVGGRQYGASEDIETLQGKTMLRLADLEQSKNAVLHSLGAASSQESYGHAIDEFIGWYYSEPRLLFNRTVVLRYRFFLEQKNLAPIHDQRALSLCQASRL